MINVQLDTRGLRRLLVTVPKQARFAAANTLNAVALEARDVERNTLEGRMTIRRPWVKQGIQIPKGKSATKANLSTEIEVERKRDFLNKFEPGGIKRARGGHSLAIRDEDAFKHTQVTPDRLRPKALDFRAHKTKGGNVTFQGKARGKKGTRKTHSFGGTGGQIQWKGKQRTFIIEHSTFERGIYQRIGHSGKRESIRLLYWLGRTAKIAPDLRFRKTVEAVVRRRWAPTFNREFAKALRTARV